MRPEFLFAQRFLRVHERADAEISSRADGSKGSVARGRGSKCWRGIGGRGSRIDLQLLQAAAGPPLPAWRMASVWELGIYRGPGIIIRRCLRLEWG